ncbi:MAG: peptidylprolyl isomerase [Alphaproteobacteria bacterium]|nr:peptidylprolyl isomerase [Alphaproteobacteria bacterium]NNF72503.1 peptidylprolyl isomerase [Paracoccaceae bacterium]
MGVLLVVIATLPPGPALAQGQFSPVLRVNDKAITPYELEQRTRLLRVLGATASLETLAREALIDERLQVEAAETLGLTVTEDEVTQGIAEFAERGNVTGEALLAQLGSAGVAEETFRDFVSAGILWREVVRARFGPRTQVSEADVERAVALSGRTGGARVLLSEILLPARNPQEAEAAEARARQFSQLPNAAAFEQAARDFSAAQSRANGGRIDWIPLSAVPAELRNTLLTLPPGSITEPVRLQNAVVVLLLRALEELPPTDPTVLAAEYATVTFAPGDASDAREMAAAADSCDDLYGLTRGLPDGSLIRETRAVGDIPADIARALESLDGDEVSLDVTRGESPLLVMLCGRTTEVSEDIDRAEVRRQLVNQRLGSYASGYLAELRADAVIVETR